MNYPNFIKLNLIFVLFIISQICFAEAPTEIPKESDTQTQNPTSSNATPPAEPAPLVSKNYRENSNYSILFNYSAFDLWIPSKIGATVTFYSSTEAAYEFEYLSASPGYDIIGVDLGKITDQRISLLKRSFHKRNTLNFMYGFNYSDFRVILGDDLLESVSGDKSQYELLRVSTLGLSWGVGNRWQMSSGTTIGVDWFMHHIPIYTLSTDSDYLTATTSSEDKEDVEDVLNVFKHFPTLGFIKFQIGMSF